MCREIVGVHACSNPDLMTHADAMPIFQAVAYAFDRAAYRAFLFDPEALAQVAHAHGISLIVDNTVGAPILLRLTEHRADIAVHSVTTFLGGNGTTLGDAAGDSGRFPWSEYRDRFPIFNLPDPLYHGLVYVEHFGSAGYFARCRGIFLRTNAGLSHLAPGLGEQA